MGRTDPIAGVMPVMALLAPIGSHRPVPGAKLPTIASITKLQMSVTAIAAV
jgi:hypothetical protein